MQVVDNMHNMTAVVTLTGTALTVAANIGSHDIIKTALLAAVGAAVSFFVSLFLKWIVKKIRKNVSRD